MRCFWAEGKNGSFAFRDNQDDQNPGGTYEAAYRAHYGKQPVLGSRQQTRKESLSAGGISRAPNAERKRRRDFYLLNGYRETSVFLSYLGVDYEVFCMDRSFQEDDFKEMMKTIHIKGFSPHYFHK